MSGWDTPSRPTWDPQEGPDDGTQASAAPDNSVGDDDPWAAPTDSGWGASPQPNGPDFGRAANGGPGLSAPDFGRGAAGPSEFGRPEFGGPDLSAPDFGRGAAGRSEFGGPGAGDPAGGPP